MSGSAGGAAPLPLAGRRAGIAGTGLIGASIGLAAAAAGAETLGWDADPSALRAAAARGAIDREVSGFETLAAQLGTDDVLILATPLEATLAALAELERAASRGTAGAGLVLDVASVKRPVAAAGRRLAGFVASHPIAGSERSGPAAARRDLFAGKVWTLDADAAPAARTAAAAFVRALGARPLELGSEEHDAVLAFTSHLPQLISVALGDALAARLDDARAATLCGTGMRSMTRLGSSPWTMWRGIVTENSGSLGQELRNFAAVLSAVADEIEAGDGAGLENRFARAAAANAALDRDGMPERSVEVGKEAISILFED